jgi:hypothetical protein
MEEIIIYTLRDEIINRKGCKCHFWITDENITRVQRATIYTWTIMKYAAMEAAYTKGQ